ncbi:hypothetical protein BpHYR1_006271 [Brachionus plicatilis]|uniref:Uncharacterized protein n=1 Tax=Brachionus plicatilis TaxID=10195 RepID=A0A3M7RB85_BRAPC|nr:hypothetical protein BpHYR1_006271 [Brachionus plicatilis]
MIEYQKPKIPTSEERPNLHKQPALYNCVTDNRSQDPQLHIETTKQTPFMFRGVIFTGADRLVRHRLNSLLLAHKIFFQKCPLTSRQMIKKTVSESCKKQWRLSPSDLIKVNKQFLIFILYIKKFNESIIFNSNIQTAIILAERLRIKQILKKKIFFVLNFIWNFFNRYRIFMNLFNCHHMVEHFVLIINHTAEHFVLYLFFSIFEWSKT